jgi:hypothetical protein
MWQNLSALMKHFTGDRDVLLGNSEILVWNRSQWQVLNVMQDSLGGVKAGGSDSSKQYVQSKTL